MSHSSLEQQLDRVELQFNAVSSALIGGDPEAVQAASAMLQQLAVRFVQMVDEMGRDRAGSVAVASLSPRIQALAAGMPALRENLLRRSAYVERALQLVVPATQKTTYAAHTGPYGSGARRSGAFNVFSA